MPYGLNENQIGTEATHDTRRQWPERDVTGARYLRGNGEIIRALPGGKFVVIPAGQDWTPQVEDVAPKSDSGSAPAPVEPPTADAAPKSKDKR